MTPYNMCRKLILLGFLFFIITTNARAQFFDYTERPVLDYDFLSADIVLEVDPSNVTVEGSVTYRLRANISGADTLVLHAPGIQINSVSAGGNQVNYSTENGRLFIFWSDSTAMGTEYQLQINYRAAPRFGLLKDSDGAVWTSMLPRSKRHWLPVFDHPRVEMIITLAITLPANYSLAATGVKTNEQILGFDSKTVTYRSSKPIPITSLAFAVGNFSREGSSYGIKRISSYAEPNTINRSEQIQLTNEARNIISEIEDAAELKYPFQGLHIVILNDHYWETKPYGASVIYLYQNRGELVNQLRRGLYAQWFGVFQHEEQWSAAWPVQFLQAALHYSITDEPAALKKAAAPATNFSTVYNKFSVKSWNYWQKYPEWSPVNTQLIAEQNLAKILQKGSGVFTPQRYENIWYQLSGQPSMDLSVFTPTNGPAGMATDSIRYRVDFQQLNGALKLVFTAMDRVVSEPVTLPLSIISNGRATSQEVSFSGVKDSLTVTLPAQVQNVRFVTEGHERLFLEVHKPVPYILYQLQHAENTQVKERAALQLGYHTDNPDLQLLLTNYLKRDMQPEVEAALLRSYGAITNGAAGTQQYFLDALSSNSPVIQQAALEALQNYPDNAVVTERIQGIVESGNNLSGEVLSAYLSRLDSTQVLSFTNTLIKDDTAGTKAISAIAVLGELGQTEAAIERAEFYINPVYAYAVRKKAFGILLRYDNAAERWKGRLEMLLTDYDPRIRYMTIKNFAEIPVGNKQAVLQEFIPVAYDARIYNVINNQQ